ncbi:MAG: hypothetical protein ACRDJ9_23160 [Dehalococcoidia bacterium]
MDGMPGMGSMEGMSAGEAAAGTFWETINAHLDSVRQLEPSRLVFARAGHDSIARRALERMDQDMAAMAMPPDGAWQALRDSVRRDLAALRTLTGEAFVMRVRGNAGRLRRLIERHEEMMAPMKGMQ